jgi:hypothetical protein
MLLYQEFLVTLRKELSWFLGAKMIRWHDRLVKRDKLTWFLGDHLVNWIERPVDRDKLLSTHDKQSSLNVDHPLDDAAATNVRALELLSQSDGQTSAAARSFWYCVDRCNFVLYSDSFDEHALLTLQVLSPPMYPPVHVRLSLLKANTDLAVTDIDPVGMPPDTD